MTDLNQHRFNKLLLCRVAAKSARPPSKGQLASDLSAMVTLSPSELKVEIGHALGHLSKAGFLKEKPIQLTEAGEREVASTLALSRVPQLAWRQLKRLHVLPMILELPASATTQKRLKDADGLRGCALKSVHELSGSPTLNQAIDALVWRELGADDLGQVTVNKVRKLMLERILGSPLRGNMDGVKRRFVASSIQAKSSDVAALQNATIKRWLNTPQKSPTSQTSQTPTPLDPKSFASLVDEVARGEDTLKFGEDRVFIASVWRELHQLDEVQPMSLDEFKANLIEAAQHGFIKLNRADLVDAMDPRVVAESETAHMGGVFHFIRLEPQ